MFVVAELMFTGRPAIKMPDGWRGYDVIAEADADLIRISVKGMRFDSRRANRNQAGGGRSSRITSGTGWLWFS